MRLLRIEHFVRLACWLGAVLFAVGSAGQTALAVPAPVPKTTTAAATTEAQRAYAAALAAIGREPDVPDATTIRTDIEMLTRILAMRPIDPATVAGALYERAFYYGHVPNLRLALADVHAAIAAYPTALALYSEGAGIADDAGDRRQADAFLKAGVAINPSYTAILAGKAASNLKTSAGRALIWAQMAVRSDPSSAIANGALCLAIVEPLYHGGGDVRAAATDCRTATTMTSGLTPAMIFTNEMNSAFASSIARDYRRAQSDLDRAFALSTNPSCQLLFVRGSVELGTPAKLAQAVADFRKAKSMCPDTGAIHMWLGTAVYRQGDAATAQSEWQTAVRLEPSFQPVLDRFNEYFAGVEARRNATTVTSETFDTIPSSGPSDRERMDQDQRDRAEFQSYADYEQHANDNL